MNQDRKRQLTELGAEALADALLELAASGDAGEDLVKRMIATPKDNIKRYKAKSGRTQTQATFRPMG